jgi:predicted  nucleic acid-binding Zn-ribbon protein
MDGACARAHAARRLTPSPSPRLRRLTSRPASQEQVDKLSGELGAARDAGQRAREAADASEARARGCETRLNDASAQLESARADAALASRQRDVAETAGSDARRELERERLALRHERARAQRLIDALGGVAAAAAQAVEAERQGAGGTEPLSQGPSLAPLSRVARFP